MTFLEAVKAPYEGKKIRHKNWSNKDDFIYLKDNVIKSEDGYSCNALLVSDDYELYEEPKTRDCPNCGENMNEELKIRLEQHKMWLIDKSTGNRFVAKHGEIFYSANLRSADLSSADFSFANLSFAIGFKFTPLQVVNTKFFITIFDDHVMWGCRKMTFDEVKKFNLNDCSSIWDKDEFNLNKKIITEMIRYYRK